MYEREFEKIERIIDEENFEEQMRDYNNYYSAVINFRGNKEDVSSIFHLYKANILKMILKSELIKDEILKDKISEKRNNEEVINNVIRHDLDIKENVDFEKVFENIFKKTDNLNYYENRARVITLMEIIKMINLYGMERLNSDQKNISKELELGIFEAKNDNFIKEDELKKVKQRIRISETFGEEAIPYIENLDLLKSRAISLRVFSDVQEETIQIDEIISQLNEIDKKIKEKDDNVTELLKQVYAKYENINRKMIANRLFDEKQEVIDNINDERVMLLHFIPNFNNEFDYEKEKNPFDLKGKISLKNTYIDDSLNKVITKKYTELSTSIAKVGGLKPHLDRKIAMGFSKVPIESIKTINKGYNNALDRFSFEKNSIDFPKVIKFVEKGGTNETLVDWTKIEPSYILVVKDVQEISEDLLKEAEKFSKQNNLPIKIYDAYEIEKNKEKQQRNNENKPIEGVYNSNDLSVFAKVKCNNTLIKKMLEEFKDPDKEKGGVGR